MNNRIDKTISKFNMLSFGDRVLAAVSGGADSMLMLNYFIWASDLYNLDLCVAHVEHGIRGTESVDDADFVRDFCTRNRIEYHQLNISAVSEARKEKMSVEEYSRKKRYEFFDTIDCDKIATAHNLSDNIETVLFRISRGTGLTGACGIPAVRGKIIRPLIEISSKDIRKYCDLNSIEYRTDSTNSDNDYSRNYIRNVVVPEFERLSGGFENNFSDFITNINEDEAYIKSAVAVAYEECLSDNKLVIEKLRQYDVAIKKRVIRKYFSENGIQTDKIHLNEIVKLIDKCARVQIKGDIFAVSDKDYLRYARFDNEKADFSYKSEILNIFEFNNKSVDFYCDYDKIVGNVYFKTRGAGDMIRPAGRNCTKTLKKLFNEYRIPPEKRDKIAVAYDDIGAVAVVGYCVDERVCVDENTKKILSFKLSTED